MARDDDPAARFVERFAAALVESGWPRGAARVFVAIMASERGRLTAAELTERLRLSPAAVSGAVRYLTQIELVHREREPGSRRDVYAVEDDVWLGAIRNRDRLLARWVATLREGAEAVGRDTDAGRRLADSADFFAYLERETPRLIDRWLELRRG